MRSHLPALIVLAPLCAAVAAPLAAFAVPRAAKALSLAALAASAAASMAALRAALSHGALRYEFGGWAAPWGIEYVLDPLSGALAVLVSGLALASAVYAWGWDNEASPARTGAFQALSLLLTAGLLGIVVTADLFNLYVFLEITSLSAYALAAAGERKAAPMAAFRYLLVGSAGASFWVLGTGFLYAVTGTLNMSDLARLWPQVSDTPAAAAGVGLMTAGLLLKMPVFPLHGWQPEVYATAPARVMPLMGSLVSKVMAYALLRLLYSTLGAHGAAGGALAVLGPIGALSALAGAWLAIGQADLRRLLAYSSVSQLGYLLMGFSIGGRWALLGALWHVFSHAVLKCALFMASGALGRLRGSTALPEAAGLARRHPAVAAAMAAAMLGLVGLPPTSGFVAKWFLLRGALETGQWPYVAVLAASALLAAGYAFRTLEPVLLAPAPAAPARAGRLDVWALTPLAALAAAAAVVAFASGPLVETFLTPALGNLG